MKSILSAVFYIIVVVALKIVFVQGLQCYVCDDCNEYEDFKELEICEAVVVKTTQIPNVPTEAAMATNTIAVANGKETTMQPPSIATIGGEVPTTIQQQMGGNNQTATTLMGPIMGPATTLNAPNMNSIGSTSIPQVGTTNLFNGIIDSTTTLAPNAITTLKPVQQPMEYDYMEYEDPKVLNANPLFRAEGSEFLTTLEPKPQFENYDYLEYEDAKGSDDKLLSKIRARQSLVMINKPVCYMYRYHANNTIFTKRGCTTSINDNSYLTCQSLYTGHPISGCRICSTDGCNKYSDDESGEDHIYSGCAMQHLSLIVISLLTLVSVVGV